ncbi:PREDICTED: reverse mRNAase [Prunus dulcis]|uniref:PREDICTED: reverse mRNAase n=1 Tax=Prunus dulcis TaxID=3755 RepID=A0A5E4GFF0_PRUDU|nr:PREDICTED: reverse mRNAase [Prunus dulcis]
MNRHRLNQIRRQCGFCKSFVVDLIGTASGLCLWWKPSVEVEIQDWSKNWIDTCVKSDTDHTFGRFTWLCGTLYNTEKTAFWECIYEWDKGDQIPWIVSGDMNEVLWNFEKEGGAPWNPRRRRYLLEFMESNSLIDLGFSGQCFTWEKRCTDNVVVRERLDSFLGDNSASPGKRNKVFRFEASWAEDPDCKELIGRCWSGNVEGSGILVLRELERFHMSLASDNTLQQQESIKLILKSYGRRRNCTGVRDRTSIGSMLGTRALFSYTFQLFNVGRGTKF